MVMMMMMMMMQRRYINRPLHIGINTPTVTISSSPPAVCLTLSPACFLRQIIIRRNFHGIATDMMTYLADGNPAKVPPNYYLAAEKLKKELQWIKTI